MANYSARTAHFCSRRAKIGAKFTCVVVLIASIVPFGASAAPLDITVEGVRNNSGTIDLCLFDRQSGFPDCTGGGALQRRRAPASQGHVRFALDAPPGGYAVTVMHDEKGTGRLERNFLGIPRSGVGASNNPRAHFGPPSFDDARFRLPPEGVHLTVTLIYP